MAACGVQDTPPGNAEVSLAARLEVVGPVAAAAAGRDEGVLLLIDGTDLNVSADTRDRLAVHAGDIDQTRTAAVTDAVEEALR